MVESKWINAVSACRCALLQARPRLEDYYNTLALPRDQYEIEIVGHALEEIDKVLETTNFDILTTAA